MTDIEGAGVEDIKSGLNEPGRKVSLEILESAFKGRGYAVQLLAIAKKRPARPGASQLRCDHPALHTIAQHARECLRPQVPDFRYRQRSVFHSKRLCPVDPLRLQHA